MRVLRSLLVAIRFSREAARHAGVTVLGFREGRGDSGLTYDDDPYSDRSVAYDVGRTLRRLDA